MRAKSVLDCGWTGKGAITIDHGNVVYINPDGDLVGIIHAARRSQVVVLRPKPNPDLLAAKAEITKFAEAESLYDKQLTALGQELNAKLAEIERLGELLAAANMQLAGRLGAGQVDLKAAMQVIDRLKREVAEANTDANKYRQERDQRASLRDQFAMAALTGLIAGHHPVNAPREAFGIADLVMAERAKVAGNG